jgi:hypothetical protein
MKDVTVAKAITKRFLEENKLFTVLNVYEYLLSRGFSFTMNEVALLIRKIEEEKRNFVCPCCKQTYHISERVQHDQGTMCVFCAEEYDSLEDKELLSHYD